MNSELTTPLLFVVAVLAISSSAVLVRWTELPALTLAWWRTALGGLILLMAARRARPVERLVPVSRRAWVVAFGAGAALAVHFWAWLASLDRTSVAASTTLVSTAPFLLALDQRRRGRPVSARSWSALTVGLIGVVVILAGSEASWDGGDLDGNLLALLGAAAMAVYLGLGDHLRRDVGMSTADYAAVVYLSAAAVLTVVAVVTTTPLWSFLSPICGRDVLVVAGMVAGPQLLGHTVLNHLLERLGGVTVSFALLAEPVGATFLALILLGEVPPVITVVGAALVLGALAARLSDRTP